MKKDLEKYVKEKDSLEKKLKRKMIDAKAQAQLREKKKMKIQQMAEQAGVEMKTRSSLALPGRPRVEQHASMRHIKKNTIDFVNLQN